MPLSSAQQAAIDSIVHLEIRSVCQFLASRDVDILAMGSLYRLGQREMGLKDLMSYICSHATYADTDKQLNNTSLVETAIRRYTMLKGLTPRFRDLHAHIALAPHATKKRALELAFEMARWSLVGAGPAEATKQHEILEEIAHFILRFIENVKLTTAGRSLDGRQMILSVHGDSGAGKSQLVKKLLEPLGSFANKTSSLERALDGFETGILSEYAAVWVDDMAPLSTKMIPLLKDMVYSPTWRAEAKGKDVEFRPITATLIFTHNPPPDIQFPDPAMARRLGLIHYQRALDPVAGRQFVEDNIVPFDALELWRNVDPDNRVSDDAVILRGQKRNAIRETIDIFVSEHVMKCAAGEVDLMEFYAAFRARGSIGGWDLRKWTDRNVYEWLRAHRFNVKRTAKGVKISGISLSDVATSAAMAEADFM